MTCREMFELAQKESQGSVLDFLSLMYRQLSRAGEDSPALLQDFFENYYRQYAGDSEKESRFLDNQSIAGWFRKYQKMTEGYVDYLSKCLYTESDFYKKVWEYLNNSDIFPDDKNRAIAFCCICVHPMIPYYQIQPGLQMDNSDYRQISEEVYTYRNKIQFIMKQKFEQKTEQASAILSILDSIKGAEQRTVLLSLLISDLQNSSQGDAE